MIQSAELPDRCFNRGFVTGSTLWEPSVLKLVGHLQIHYVSRDPPPFIAMSFEEIHISTTPADFVDEPAPAARAVRASLEQHNRLRFRKQTFKLLDRRILSVQVDGIFKRFPAYEFNIGILDPEPERQVRIGWRYVLAFLVLATTATLTATTDLVRDSTMLSSVLAAAAGLSLILAAYSYHDLLVFYSKNGYVPLVILLRRKPDDASVRLFTDALIRSTLEVRDSFASRSEMLSEELKEHRCLREQGLISEKQYDGIRQHILGLHQSDPRAHGHRAHRPNTCRDIGRH